MISLLCDSCMLLSRSNVYRYNISYSYSYTSLYLRVRLSVSVTFCQVTECWTGLLWPSSNSCVVFWYVPVMWLCNLMHCCHRFTCCQNSFMASSIRTQIKAEKGFSEVSHAIILGKWNNFLLFNKVSAFLYHLVTKILMAVNLLQCGDWKEFRKNIWCVQYILYVKILHF